MRKRPRSPTPEPISETPQYESANYGRRKRATKSRSQYLRDLQERIASGDAQDNNSIGIPVIARELPLYAAYRESYREHLLTRSTEPPPNRFKLTPNARDRGIVKEKPDEKKKKTYEPKLPDEKNVMYEKESSVWDVMRAKAKKVVRNKNFDGRKMQIKGNGGDEFE